MDGKRRKIIDDILVSDAVDRSTVRIGVDGDPLVPRTTPLRAQQRVLRQRLAAITGDELAKVVFNLRVTSKRVGAAANTRLRNATGASQVGTEARPTEHYRLLVEIADRLLPYVAADGLAADLRGVVEGSNALAPTPMIGGTVAGLQGPPLRRLADGLRDAHRALQDLQRSGAVGDELAARGMRTLTDLIDDVAAEALGPPNPLEAHSIMDQIETSLRTLGLPQGDIDNAIPAIARSVGVTQTRLTARARQSRRQRADR